MHVSSFKHLCVPCPFLKCLHVAEPNPHCMDSSPSCPHMVSLWELGSGYAATTHVITTQPLGNHKVLFYIYELPAKPERCLSCSLWPGRDSGWGHDLWWRSPSAKSYSPCSHKWNEEEMKCFAFGSPGKWKCLAVFSLPVHAGIASSFPFAPNRNKQVKENEWKEITLNINKLQLMKCCELAAIAISEDWVTLKY